MSNEQSTLVGFSIAIFFMAVIAIIALFDAWAIFSGAHCWTVSDWLQHWSASSPLIPLAIGLVIGHLFFGKR